MTYQAFLIKYSEIGVKGKNRYVFEDALVTQIKRALDPVEGKFVVRKQSGRILVSIDGEYDYDEAVDALQHVFGISAICPTVVVPDEGFEAMAEAVIKYVDEEFEDKNFSFKVMGRRANKQYPMTSMEVAAEIGARLLDAFPEMHVDVHKPERIIYVEVRENIAIYSTEIPGPHGMPVGTAGKAMLLLSGGIDSPVAGYMIAKRGVNLSATYFHAPPYTSEQAKQKVVDLAKLVAKYSGPIDLHIVNFTDIQLYIYEQCAHEELTIIMRRYMMRIAEHFAKENDCLGLVTGESIGQVASQTMQSLNCTNAVCSLPVYRPLIAFDKQDIVDISEKIDTYETSILPYEDCCTIFVAKHPVTKPKLEAIEKHEHNLDEKIDELMKQAIESVEIVKVR
ncbi:tRNA uracil 4-sulfurtransferase ThiI [Pseudobutyrivibrio sp.]|uniref:tRNA uracil 4-sulfurtransferase ThiI n=1 Tax=Pseudobutyrivibrio sp. TaxID=2014367 RepID=UPI00386DDC47